MTKTDNLYVHTYIHMHVQYMYYQHSYLWFSVSGSELAMLPLCSRANRQTVMHDALLLTLHGPD